MAPLLASDYDKSKYLRAEDLKQEKKFRIKAVTEEVFDKGDGKPEKKLTLWFTNDERGLPLNKTNNRTIRAVFGDPLAGWINKVIVVFPTLTDLRGKMTPALRVRIPPPKQAAAAPPQPVTSGNGAAAPPAAGPVAAAAPTTTTPATAAAPSAATPVAAAALLAAAAMDPELEPDPVKPIREDLDDDVPW